MEDAYAAPVDGAVDFDIRGRASMTNTLGTISVILCLVAPCAGCTTLMCALPLSLITVHYGRTVLAEEPDEVSTVYARTGLTLGVISLTYSLILLLVVLAYFGMNAAMVAAIVLGNV